MREKTVHTFIWNGRLCWIAGEIAEVLGYDDPASAVRNCIEAEEFEPGFEYEVLKGSDLKKFKEMVNYVIGLNPISSKTPNLTIFYEEGLYGFLTYTDKPEGKRFKKWIRRDVVPEIRKTGGYELPGRKGVEKLTRADVDMEKIKNERAKILLGVAEKYQNILSPESIQLMVCKAAEIVAGASFLPLPETEKTYSAGDIGREAGLSANMVGRLAEAHNLKTEEYGKYVLDKSPYSDKQVVTFRYNERGRKRLLELAAELKAENEKKKRRKGKKAGGEPAG
ncbi:Bro-N domain-containing protein [Desulfofundulus sp. TPOSR]|uniref:BRO-N domain-containing protein n=1 Tax=Desulfofundulus sp. TPOSR TaxID=2714340 RepID=UPI001409D75C|nr:Bro-N domain-containing protein [Desulfofundulus sp. TPOSR]NHM25966.1 Bro-N domain-containing protein [Desulfofundulus sp. TPOSR]